MAMFKYICLLTTLFTLNACDTFDNDVISGKDSGKGDAYMIGELNEKQTETVNEFYKQGQINSVERQEMDNAINGASAGTPAGE